MFSWASLLSGLVSLANWLANQLSRAQIRQDAKNEVAAEEAQLVLNLEQKHAEALSGPHLTKDQLIERMRRRGTS